MPGKKKKATLMSSGEQLTRTPQHSLPREVKTEPSAQIKKSWLGRKGRKRGVNMAENSILMRQKAVCRFSSLPKCFHCTIV